jgi:PTS system ascorbate-specific IIA component
MSVGVLLITHPGIGSALLANAELALGRCPMPVECIEVGKDSDPDERFAQAKSAVQRLDRGRGVLVLTDLCGSTPANIAVRLISRKRARTVGGVSLPMLIRVFNYCGLDLDELVVKAVTGGQNGVFEIMPTNENRAHG